MGDLSALIAKNKIWAKQKKAIDPDFFTELSKGQSPKYLWIGCSDSRVAPATLSGLDQGDIFVTRNISNLVLHTDFNALSAIQYAVDILKVEEIIVCGHYGCSGINASMGITPFGLADNWIRNIRDVFIQHKDELYTIKDPIERSNRLVELNVLKQVYNTCYTNIVQAAWINNKNLTVHGCVFDLGTGLLKKLDCSISSIEQIDDIYKINI
jgi:carbonic anhydrase